MLKKRFDVLSVGDVVTDAFIDLIEKYEYVEKDKKGGLILNIPLGAKIPYDRVKVVEGVGNAPNASVAFSRLGLKSGMVTNVGSDMWGEDIIKAFKKNKVDTRFVKVNRGKISNYHYVLWYEAERTILIKHEEYSYRWQKLKRADIPRWIYFSSVSDNALPYHDEISDWLDEHPDVKLAFQPGTFQMMAGVQKMKRLYARADVVALNREEARDVFKGDHKNIHDLLDKMHKTGIKIAVITDGPDGAYASDGNKRWKMPLYPDPAPPFERTGAGDAFAATFAAALIKGYDVPTALKWAPINSMNVVQHIGAQDGLLNEAKLKYYLKKAPKNYLPKEI